MYSYNATVERVVDGDTVELLIDLGFKVLYRHSCRLEGINAPEHTTPEGVAAAQYLTGLLPPGTAVLVETTKDRSEKYGRILGMIFLPVKGAKRKSASCVNDDMVQAGHAKWWDGKGERPT